MLCIVHGALRRALRCALRSHSRHLAQVMGGSSGHNKSGKGKRCQGKRSQGGKGGTGSKSSKGNQGSSQGSKGSKGSPDGGLSPSAAESEPAYRGRGVSEKEGAWRLTPLPEDRVLKVLVPFLGNALCCYDEMGPH